MESNSQRGVSKNNNESEKEIEEEKSEFNNKDELSNKSMAKNILPDQVLSIEELLLNGNGTKRDFKYYRQMLLDCVLIRREIHGGLSWFWKELKYKIEKTMNLKPKAMKISDLLSQILTDAVKFDKEKHSKLIVILIDALKGLGKPGTPEFRTDNEAKVLREFIIDFLFKIKDKHPFGDAVERKIMEVLDITMEILIGYSFKPNVDLLKEYTESKITKKLNTLPPLEYLNSKFWKYNQMSEENYEFLRKKLESSPPFIFYFNPDIELKEVVQLGNTLLIGFFAKGTYERIGVGMSVSNSGYMEQGYFKDDKLHLYGSGYWGVTYEGEVDMGYINGRGEVEFNEDGRVEVGQRDRYRGKEGEFEVYDKTGKLTHRKFYVHNDEVKSEEVTEEIYRKK